MVMGALAHAALGAVTIASLYAPDSSSLAEGAPADRFLTQAFRLVAEQAQPFIIAGDFNQPPSALQGWMNRAGLRHDIL